MKNSNEPIGNRTRDLPACSPVSQQLRHRVPPHLLRYTATNCGEQEVALYRGLTAVKKVLEKPAASVFTVFFTQVGSTLHCNTGVRVDQNYTASHPERPSFDVKSRAELNSLSPGTVVATL